MFAQCFDCLPLKGQVSISTDPIQEPPAFVVELPGLPIRFAESLAGDVDLEQLESRLILKSGAAHISLRRIHTKTYRPWVISMEEKCSEISRTAAVEVAEEAADEVETVTSSPL